MAPETPLPAVTLPPAHDGMLLVEVPGELLRAYGKSQIQLRLDVLIRRLSVVAKIET
jgi:hypothetical protein